MLRFAESGERMNFQGRHYRYSNVPVVLEPYQKPRPPLWYGIGSPDTAVWATENNVNLLTNHTAAAARVLHDRFVQEWALAKKDPAEMPFFGTSKHVVVADTDEEALALARPAHGRWIYHNTLLPRQFNYAKNRAAVEDFDQAVEMGIVFAGSPTTVRDRLMKYVDESGINYLNCRIAFGDLTDDQSKRTLDLLASSVFPIWRTTSRRRSAIEAREKRRHSTVGGVRCGPRVPVGAQQPAPYALTAILSESGAGAFVGQAAGKSMVAMESYINSTGGIHGRPVKITVLDDQSSPQVAVQLVNGLIAQKTPALIGPMLTASCEAVIPLISKDGPVAYCDSPFVNSPRGGYMFMQQGSALDIAITGLRFPQRSRCETHRGARCHGCQQSGRGRRFRASIRAKRIRISAASHAHPVLADGYHADGSGHADQGGKPRCDRDLERWSSVRSNDQSVPRRRPQRTRRLE